VCCSERIVCFSINTAAYSTGAVVATAPPTMARMLVVVERNEVRGRSKVVSSCTSLATVLNLVSTYSGIAVWLKVVA